MKKSYCLPLLLICTIAMYSCIRKPERDLRRVWGFRPIYADTVIAKKIYYEKGGRSIGIPGNIYAFGHYIFQADVGTGIHVIDNSDPVNASRIGFIHVNGSQQLSIKGKYLYANSYNDLVTLDISQPGMVTEVSRLKNVFPLLREAYPFSKPSEAGHFICPRWDSLVVGWARDSIYQSGSCF